MGRLRGACGTPCRVRAQSFDGRAAIYPRACSRLRGRGRQNPRPLHILSLESGVDKDSVAADVRMIGGTVIYSYASFNMMAIKIPHSMTIDDALRAMPSFRGSAMPDQMCEIDDAGTAFH